MKRFLFLLCMMLSIIRANAQDRVLVIDNQTPGWLSSLMTYSQQISVEELKVTGYINKTDMDFINNLIRYRKLDVVDLQDVTTIDGNAREDRLWYQFAYFGVEKELRKLILPKYNTSSCIIPSKIDSLIVSSKDSVIIGETYCGVPPKYLEIREGVKYIKRGFQFISLSGEWGSAYSDYYPYRLTKIKWPNSLKIMEGNSFYCNLDNDDSFVLPPNAIRLGHKDEKKEYQWLRGIGSSQTEDKVDFPISPSRFDFPDSLKVYYCGHYSFPNEPTYIYHSYSSDTIVVGEKCDTLHANLKARVGYFKSPTPPDAENCSYNFNTLYVPKGCVEAYQKKYKELKSKIKEVQNVSSIDISPNDKEMEVGETVILKANISPYNAFDRRISWTSSDEHIAIVDGQGKVTAISPGEVVISAIAKDGGITGECNLKVLQHATGISLNPSELEFTEIGTTIQLKAEVIPEESCNKDVEWATSNMAVCHVSQSGLVTATGYGTTVVFATAVDGGYSASCVVHVKDISGISELTNQDKSADTKFSSIGVVLKAPIKGVNIVKYSDGTVRKVIVK